MGQVQRPLYWVVRRVSDGRDMGQSVSEYTDRPHLYLKRKDAERAIEYAIRCYPGYEECIPVQITFIEVRGE